MCTTFMYSGRIRGKHKLGFLREKKPACMPLKCSVFHEVTSWKLCHLAVVRIIQIKIDPYI